MFIGLHYTLLSNLRKTQNFIICPLLSTAIELVRTAVVQLTFLPILNALYHWKALDVSYLTVIVV